MKVDSVATLSGVALLNNRAIQYRYSLDKGEAIQIAANEANMSVEYFACAVTARFGSVEAC